MEYDIIMANSGPELIYRVNREINKGLGARPLGGAFVENGFWYQTMVSPKPDDPNERLPPWEQR